MSVYSEPLQLMRFGCVVAVALLVSEGRAADQPPSLELQVSVPAQWPADRAVRRPVRLTIVNHGAVPAFLSPAMAEIAGTVEILMRRTGSLDTPVRLHATTRPYAGFRFDDLFRLMPKHRVSQTFWIQYEPPFAGEGTIELWAEYDCSEMAQGDARAFAGLLRSKTVVVPIVRSEPIEK